ncbi:hypothetical protein [Candidatus Nitrosopumilus sediminis]|uniref:hypothetical protein n=1 Tax=Candidatus Nitrosopumilus sediminis TaxID=1229909 RepID=UPI00037E41F3|nr:hypothetical protein [Candidatus Nitrosopumilus sediminis]
MILSKQDYSYIKKKNILRIPFSQMREIIKSEAKIEQIIAKNAAKYSRRDYYE